ncbi:MBL fold metallo-hydrolase [Thermovibrio sp.]
MERISVVYDNRAVPPFKEDWGFSALVELEEGNLLFDTGAKPEVLEHNLKCADFDLKELDKLFISHNHWDHAGGLPLVLERALHLELFIPEPDCYQYEEELPEKVVCVPVSAPTYISERLISTGIMATGLEAPEFEQSLIVMAEPGPILITGCSHPGIVDVAKKAVSIVGETLFLTIGGFHLYRSTKEEIEEVAKELVRFTQFVAPCHCTGQLGIEVFAEVFGDKFIDAKAGVEIPLQEV